MCILTTILLQIVHPGQLLEGMYFFLIIIASLVVFMAVYLLKRSRSSARRRRLRQEFSDFISELAICDSETEREVYINNPSTKTLCDRWLSDKFARSTLIRELTSAAKNMSGQAATNICWYYEQAGLHNDTLMLLKSRQWHRKARAIQQLSHLQQKRYITRIYRLTNDKNELVRNEARIAVVKLTGFKGLRFLDVISYPVTEWQQLSLLHELAQHRRMVFPAMRRLLQSPNTSVVEFTLRLIASYQVYELQDAVLQCLSHEQASVRDKAITALMEIGEADSVNTLVHYFPHEEPRLQKQILQAIQRMGSTAHLPFLYSVLSHPNQEIMAAAARAILVLQPDGYHLIASQVASDVYPWNQLLPQLK